MDDNILQEICIYCRNTNFRFVCKKWYNAWKNVPLLLFIREHEKIDISLKEMFNTFKMIVDPSRKRITHQLIMLNLLMLKSLLSECEKNTEHTMCYLVKAFNARIDNYMISLNNEE